MVKMAIFKRPAPSERLLPVISSIVEKEEEAKEKPWLNPWFSLVGILMLLGLFVVMFRAIDSGVWSNELLTLIQSCLPIYAVCVSISDMNKYERYLSLLGIIATAVGLLVPIGLLAIVVGDSALFALYGSDIITILGEMITTILIGIGLTSK